MDYDISEEWKELEDNTIHQNNIIMVIGDVDTGKSTLCRFLIEKALAKGFTVGFVDADVGQSSLGPPTTIGMKMLNSIDELDGVADNLYFVGSLSPDRHLLQCITGTKLMVNKALDKSAQIVIVDTTGFISPPIGVVLKQHKFDLVQPDHLVCIQKYRELEPIIESYKYLSAFDIHCIKPSKSVVKRNNEVRRRFREKRFEEYFKDSQLEDIPFDQFRGQGISFFKGKEVKSKEIEIISDIIEERVVYAERAFKTLFIVSIDKVSEFNQRRAMSHFGLNYLEVREVTYFENFLVALINKFGEIVSIGIVDSVDFSQRLLKIKCKPDISSKIRLIKFGDYKV